jgi:hypothetical protein
MTNFGAIMGDDSVQQSQAGERKMDETSKKRVVSTSS